MMYTQHALERALCGGRSLNIQSDVPFGLSEIDAAWLTGALREGGVLGEEEVTGFTHRIIGEETGFLGQVVILTLEYSHEDVDAPATMVLKIPTPLKNRVMGQTMGVYEKEIRFYRDLKQKLRIRTPQHYYSALSAVDDPEMVRERLGKLQQLPVSVVAMMTVLVRWFFSLRPRRYVLLIEDVSRYRLGDQLGGCSEGDVRAALNAMAKLHSQFWDSEELDSLTWIQPVNLTTKIMHMVYMQSVGKYRKAHEKNLSARQVRLLDWLKENGLRLTETLSQNPKTLIHGDFRLDNLCFDDDRGEALVLDWQNMLAGSAALDLSYFLSAALPFDTSEEKVNELIEHYRQRLTEEGVEISPERIRWLYDVGMLAMLHRIAPILFQETLELGSDRGPEVMQMWVDKTYARLERIDFEGILDRIPN